MTKYGALGTQLLLGTKQVESTTLTMDGAGGLITTGGDVRVITTATGLLAGSPLTTDVAVLLADDVNTVCTKIRAGLNAVAAITDEFLVGGSGALITLTCLVAAADLASLNIDINDEAPCEGVVDAPTSTTTTA